MSYLKSGDRVRALDIQKFGTVIKISKCHSRYFIESEPNVIRSAYDCCPHAVVKWDGWNEVEEVWEGFLEKCKKPNSLKFITNEESHQ